MTSPSDRAATTAVAPTAVAPALRASLDTLAIEWARIGACAGARDVACIHTAFRDARRTYKTGEVLIEELSPLAAALNGRGQDSDDDEAPPRTTPSAFAALEEALPFLDVDTTAAASTRPDWPAAVDAAASARAALDTLGHLAGDLHVTPAICYDAARLEVARVATLGITGFDTPATREAMRESAIALRGVASMLRRCAGTDSGPPAAVVARLHDAAEHLDAHPDFATFDRLAYIVGWSEPALRALDDARRAAGVARIAASRVWVGATLFARGAIDVAAYAPFYAPRSSPALVALGAALFAEPALSATGTQSCAGCHQPARAFTDGRRAALSLHPGAKRLRNTPSLLTAGAEAALFADARAVTLEVQANTVLASRDEMGGSAEAAATRLTTMPRYRTAFVQAFGLTGDSAAQPVTAPRLGVALAAYVRSLHRLESRADLAFRGDTAALTRDERLGASLVLGKAGCGTCHFAPLFAGATPPLFRSIDAEVIGVPAAGDAHRVDDDAGRGAIDHMPQHRHGFKTPSLRNVALTGPYMHNGAFTTLDQVVDFYDKGGGAGTGLRVPNQTLPPTPLHLTAAERRAIVSFLRALTDTGLAP